MNQPAMGYNIEKKSKSGCFSFLILGRFYDLFIIRRLLWRLPAYHRLNSFSPRISTSSLHWLWQEKSLGGVFFTRTETSMQRLSILLFWQFIVSNSCPKILTLCLISLAHPEVNSLKSLDRVPSTMTSSYLLTLTTFSRCGLFTSSSTPILRRLSG